MTSNRIHELIEILRITKNSEDQNLPENVDSLLTDFGIYHQLENGIDRETRIEIAIAAITRGYEVEKIIEHLTWKDFEGFVARVLQENEYRCTESFRRRGTKSIEGMEIDVIGVKGRTILVIDAKMWGIRSGKASAIRDAVVKQAVRTERLAGELERLSKKIPSMSSGTYVLLPIVVTWLVEEVEIHEGVPVVPIFKLNGFILEISRFEDFVVSVTGNLGKRLQQSRL